MSLTDHPAYRVVTEHASALARRIAQEIVTDLRAVQAPLLSGDGTPLTSVWQEICVQVQGEESIFWDAYLQSMRDFALSRLASVSPPELEMLWFGTEPGWDWLWDVVNAEDSAPRHPGVDDEVVAHWIIREFVMPLAEEDDSELVARFLRKR